MTFSITNDALASNVLSTDTTEFEKCGEEIASWGEKYHLL